MFNHYIEIGRKLTINDLVKLLEHKQLTGSFIITEHSLVFETNTWNKTSNIDLGKSLN